MRRLTLLIGFAASLAAPAIEATTLNKCIDAQSKVTYSNLPCRNARETRSVEIDPPPKPDPVKRAPKPTPVAKPLPADDPAPPRLTSRQAAGTPTSRATATARQCDSLTEKLGKILDQMDQARRGGYTQEQMDKWNQETKNLEHKKQQSGCF